MRQYNKDKPKKWGFKVFALCASETGLILNFELYTGKTTVEKLRSDRRRRLSTHEVLNSLIESDDSTIDNETIDPNLLNVLDFIHPDSLTSFAVNDLNPPSTEPSQDSRLVIEESSQEIEYILPDELEFSSNSISNSHFNSTPKNVSSITITSRSNVVKPKLVHVSLEIHVDPKPSSPSSTDSSQSSSPCVRPKSVQTAALPFNLSSSSIVSSKKTNAVKEPAAKKPAAKKSVAKKSAAKTSAAKTSKKVVKKPVKRVKKPVKFASARCGSESEDTGTEHQSAGTKAVLAVINYLPKYQNYKIFFDNWFSSVSCAYTLLEKGIHSTATVQIRRVKGKLKPLSYTHLKAFQNIFF